MIARFACAFSALIATAFLAQAETAAPVTPSGLARVAIDTSAGRITVEVDRARAPVTAGNFLKYIDNGRFNGESFYRVMPYGDGGLIQGGITSNSAKLYPPIAHEPTSQTGLTHVAGTLSIARGEPGSARADFFILTTDIPGFDADPAREGDNAGYAAIGKVVEGMDVVLAIAKSSLSPTKGEGAMKGQMLDPVMIRITKAARLPVAK